MPSFIKIHEVQHVEKKRKVSARTLCGHYYKPLKSIILKLYNKPMQK